MFDFLCNVIFKHKWQLEKHNDKKIENLVIPSLAPNVAPQMQAQQQRQSQNMQSQNMQSQNMQFQNMQTQNMQAQQQNSTIHCMVCYLPKFSNK